nr:MAG TPA: hypothetical protein [Caudoviricetes sp.]
MTRMVIFFSSTRKQLRPLRVLGYQKICRKRIRPGCIGYRL